MQQKLNYLLDRSRTFDEDRVQILDQLTLAMGTNSPQARQAHQIWRRLKQDNYFWYFSDRILQLSQVNQTKVFTLIILEQAIKQKWFALPQQQRDGLKSYIVNIVLNYGGVQNLSKPMHNILSKANSVLVQIVKYQWNTTWTSFILDICNASLKDMSICQNNLSILKMLSQEIFDYSKNQMTQKQISQLKQQMVKDFTNIFQLCRLVLDNISTAKQTLVKACLETLHAFLSWIPMYYIIYSDLIDKLIVILQSDYLRSYSMACLVEIAGLKIQTQSNQQIQKFLIMLKNTTIQLFKIFPLHTDMQSIQKFKNSIRKKANIYEILSRNITMFYSQFFKQQNYWLEQSIQGNIQMIEICRAGFNYMLMIMRMDDDQVWKICIQFFHYYVGRYLDKIDRNQFHNNINGYGNFNNQIRFLQDIYKEVFIEVMKIISLKMAKPEEVLIVIDEDGMPVREQVQNTQNSSLYQIMRQLASYLVKVDWPEMKKFIINQIEAQQINQNFSFQALNSLSWMVGSLCGSILQKEQKNFFISSLRTLLHLCQNKKGKQNKAVIASCIMYVVGQYPTFLRSNWSFLKTVIRKLFQFMKQQFPGILEMACNAFLKIVKSTADQFVVIQPDQNQPYIRQIVRRIPQQTLKMNADSLKFIFYQAIGFLIGAEKDPDVQVDLIKQALGYHLYQFYNIISSAAGNTNILMQQEIKRKVLFFLKLCENLATGSGQKFAFFLEQITENMNKLYVFYSQQINVIVQKQGKNVLGLVTVKLMRAIKKQVLRVYIKYIQKCHQLTQEQAQYILTQFIHPLGNFLKDFQDCAPQTKQQQFVTLFTVVLTKLYNVITPQFLSALISMIFKSSLPLITTDFNSFPEIRQSFFIFLKAIIKYNFVLLYSLDQSTFDLILDCVVWSLRHQLCTYSDLGLDLLEQILVNVNTNQQIMSAFYSKYLVRLATDILQVMTDGFHKSGLQSQSKILYILIQVSKTNIINGTISANQSVNEPNAGFLYNYMVDKLAANFPNTAKNVTLDKVSNWFQQNDEQQFKLQIADYLVLINRYTPAQIVQAQKQQNNGNVSFNSK